MHAALQQESRACLQVFPHNQRLHGPHFQALQRVGHAKYNFACSRRQLPVLKSTGVLTAETLRHSSSYGKCSTNHEDSTPPSAQALNTAYALGRTSVLADLVEEFGDQPLLLHKFHVCQRVRAQLNRLVEPILAACATLCCF